MPGARGEESPSSRVAGALSRTARFLRRHNRTVAPAATVLAIVFVLLLNGLSPAEQPARPFGRVIRTACRVEQVWLNRMARDYFPGRAGDIEMVPEEPNFVAGPHGEITHEGPWTNLQHVPMFMLGQDYIKSDRTKLRTVTTAAVAPTLASLLGFTSGSWIPEAAPLAEGIRFERPERPPKLVLTVVWEGSGRNVLAKWTDSWPDLTRLLHGGTWYEKASVGTSPSAAAAAQAVMGTAVFPRTHGIVGDSYRMGKRIVPAYSSGPSGILVPSLADLYDRAEHGRALVGLLGSDTAGLGLIGHGASFPGGDRDIVALHSPSGRDDRWGIPHAPWADDFRAPRALDHLRGLHGRFDTPAGTDYETSALERLIETEHFGRDDVADLLFASYGLAQRTADRFGMGSPQMGDAVEALDAQLPRLRTFLNRTVGTGRWVMIVTADHGSTPNPKVVGAFIIDPSRLVSDIQRRFGGGAGEPSVVTGMSASQIWLNMPLLHERGSTSYDVSRFLLDYTTGDNRGGRVEGGDRRVFQAAFPTNVLPLLPCLGS
jgi:Type I phosphodiesterase / nucleotide pyrophosphatase